MVEDAKRDWNAVQACEIMRINPAWFVDERILELCEIYLFYRQDPSRAFPGTLGDQPIIWVEAKIILDSVFGMIGLN